MLPLTGRHARLPGDYLNSPPRLANQDLTA